MTAHLFVAIGETFSRIGAFATMFHQSDSRHVIGTCRPCQGAASQMHITPDTSPEAAVKVAYDFGRRLRRSGAQEEDLIDDMHEWVDTPHYLSPLLRYLRAGFAAGFRGAPLPWVKEIDALQPFVEAGGQPSYAAPR